MDAVIKLLLELGPLVLFFLINSFSQPLTWGGVVYEPIYQATAAFMVLAVVSLVISRLMLKKWPVMPVVSAIFVIVFGGLTLYLHDDTFIKIKPTIVNLLFAGLLWGGLLRGQFLLQYIFGEQISFPPRVWRILTHRWAVFFCVLSALNEIAWRMGGTDLWVSYKTWGAMPLTLLFTMAQVPLMQKGMEEMEATLAQEALEKS